MSFRYRHRRLRFLAGVFGCCVGLSALAACGTTSADQPTGRPADGTAPVFPPKPTDALPCKLAVAAELPVLQRAGHLFVDAVVNDKPVQMMFDTGSEFTILTPQAEKRLRLDRENFPASKVYGIGGEQSAVNFQADTLWLGKLYAKDFDFVVADVGFQDGLIGSDLLYGFDVDLNFQSDQIRLFVPKHDCSDAAAYLTGKLHKVDLEATVLPGMTISRATVAEVKIHVSVGGQSLIAQIDSGAPHSLLFPSGAAKLRLTQQAVARDARGVSSGIGMQVVPTIFHTLPDLSIGDVKIADVPVSIVAESSGFGGPDMLIGLDMLNRAHFWISHSSAKLIVQYPPRPSPPLPAQ
jgi:predicted aspartyl protease